MSVSSTSSTSSSASRITGLVSSFDTETVVEELMTAEKIPLNKLYQKKQLSEWKMDAYREMTSALKTFSDKYFNYLNSSTNMLSQSNYKIYDTSSTDEDAITISGSPDAEAGSHTVLINSLATKASLKSESAISSGIEGTSEADFSSLSGKSFKINLDGTTKTVTLDDTVTDVDSLQTLLDDTIGSGKVKVSTTDDGYLAFSEVSDSGIYKITLSDDSSGALSSLGFDTSESLSNRLNVSLTLEELSTKMNNGFTFDSDDNLNLTINDTEFSFSKDTTLSEMISKINGSSDAGVTLKYNEVSDKFEFISKKTGCGNNIKITETGSTFIEAAGITDSEAGTDASVVIDGIKYTQSNNSFTLSGVTYNLKKESTEETTVSLSLDTDAVYEKIVSFVNDYNTLIDKINAKISEEYDMDYAPLTDDEKEGMSDDEITAWEGKAKTGLLANDSILGNILSNMRTALYQSVSGVTSSISSIGIKTGTYSDKGKLEIDTTTLKEAISNNTDEVMNLFSKQSTSHSGTTIVRTLSRADRQERTSEEGLAYRLYDILQDNISTYRDSSGYKGLLIEKAGIEDDVSEYTNSFYKQIDEYDEDIEEMLEKLNDKEDRYYEKFSAMETYISNMNTQLSSLVSALS